MSREIGPGTPGSALTRGELVRRAAGIGAACLVGANARAAVAGPWSSTAANVRRFVSRPDLVPPVVTVLRSAPGTAPGLLFLAPSSGPGQRGAMIVDAGGEPVWFRPSTPTTTMNFRAALFRSRPVLTWWEGKAEHGLGVGEHVIFDQSYREIARFPAGNGLESDLHEFIVTPEGTALVLAYDIPTVDRSSVGKRRGRVIEGVVQELEIPSARVLFEWRSLDHVALTESHAQVAPAFDYLHANSIDVDGDGDLLVSARNTWAVYKLDRRTGAVIWRLGGKRSDFAMGPGTRFAWQHDARGHPGGLLTLFDNAALPQVEPQSRGIALRLDLRRLRATLVRQYLHRPPQLAHALGSVQAQSNGNILVGWGTEPYFTEYTAGGAVLLDARLPRGGQNYRALRFPWHGTPAEPPRLAAGPAGTPGLFASWNGATGVVAWHLLAGPSAGALAPAGTSSRQGFETRLAQPTGARFAAAVALGPGSRQLARTSTIAL